MRRFDVGQIRASRSLLVHIVQKGTRAQQRRSQGLHFQYTLHVGVKRVKSLDFLVNARCHGLGRKIRLKLDIEV
jgi:hypothetical protein